MNQIDAVAYLRVSTSEQANSGIGLAAQRAAVEAYAAFRGLRLVEIVEDAGVSGGKALSSRAGGARLVELVESRQVRAVLAFKLDRLFRNAADCLTTTERWDRAGVALHLLDMALDTSTPMGRAFLTMAAAFAELERGFGIERTRAALRQVKAEGGRVGRLPLGWFRIDELDESGRRVVVAADDELRAVERAVELRRSGLTLRAVAEVMTAEGWRTKAGDRWHPATVQRVCARAGL